MLWLTPIAAYLLGSVSFAYLTGRVNGIDLREHGSKNLGATNAGRVLGMRWFFVVFTCDLGKGFAAAFVAQKISESLPESQRIWLVLAAATAVILGHGFSLYHRFKGGKAVATSMGVLIALLPLTAGLTFAVWLLVWLCGLLLFKASKSDAVGPASICASAAAPIIAMCVRDHPWRMPQLPLTALVTAAAILVIVKHRSNIARLVKKNP